MEAIIKIEDKKTFNALVQFLNSLNFEVITNEARVHNKPHTTKERGVKSKSKKWEQLEKFVSPMRKGLPGNFKFNREEAHER
ncbi:MAG: hypothetical protein IIA88_00735 [Bacteroidetes bacterium]|nr:hypothetical protein [Bacteroidota bacterium]